MLETAMDIIQNSKDARTPAAIREINTLLAAVKYYQIVLRRMDRDDKVIQMAIDDANWNRNSDLVAKLKRLTDPVKVPYEQFL